jgi:hypothetical protein
MKPTEVAEHLRDIAEAIDKSQKPRRDLVAADLEHIIANLDPYAEESNKGYIIAAKKGKKKDDPKAKVRNRGKVVFPAESPKVKDNEDHFPINDHDQAVNALGRANQYKKAPKWYDGSLEELVKAVARKVKKEYPSIDVSEKSKKPGKG